MSERSPLPLSALSVALGAALIVLLALVVAAGLGGASLLAEDEEVSDAVAVGERLATADARLDLLLGLWAETTDPSHAAAYEREATRAADDLADLEAMGLATPRVTRTRAWEDRLAWDRQVLHADSAAQARRLLLSEERAQALGRWSRELVDLRQDLHRAHDRVAVRGERLAVAVVVGALLAVVLVAGAWLAALAAARRWGRLMADHRPGADVDDARRRLLLDLVDVGSFEASPHEGTLTLSAAGARLLGVEPSPEPVEWSVALARLPPGDRDALVEALSAPSTPRRSRRIAWRVRVQQRQGSARSVEIQARVLVGEDGRPYRALGLLRDVSSTVALDQARAAWTAALEGQVAVRTAEAEQRARQARELAMELAQAEHAARQRVARVLHDGLQQTLVAARLRLSLLARATHPEPVRRELDQLLSEAIEDARTLAAELDPPVDPDEALGPALDWLAARVHKRHGLRVSVEGLALEERLPDQHGVALLQAARELLFNVVKHAGTDEAEVTVRVGGGTRRLEVRDRGRGLGASVVSGVGLAHTARRLEALGGGLEVVGHAEGGCLATAWLPAGPVGAVPGPPETETPVPPLTNRRVGHRGR